MKSKSGISLIALSITIVLMSIIVTITVVNTGDSTKEANRVAFADELKTVLQSANEYYLNNGEYPVTQTYTRQAVIEMASSAEYKLMLQNEMTLNNDNATEYYLVDLDLIKISGGIFENEEETIYVINSDATDIYYPKGFEIEDEVYFSLSNKIIDINKVDSSVNNINTNSTIINTTSSINASKSTEEWTNNLTVTVTTTIVSEELYYSVGGVEQQLTGSGPYTIELSKTNLSETQITNLKTDENIYITKKIDGKTVATASINIGNLDVISPEIFTMPVVEEYSGYNLVKFLSLSEDKSGVIASYYITSIDEITAEEIVTTGIQGDATFIKLDKSISNIQMVIVDRANNVSEVINVTIPSDYVE